MTTKSIQSIPDQIAAAAIDSDDLRQLEIDAFIARNRDVLNESLIRSYEEIACGEIVTRTIDHIIAEGQKRFRARRS